MTMRTPLTVLGLALVLSTGGCGSLFKQPEEVYSVQERHPIMIDSETASLALPVPAGMTRLSPQMSAEVKAFLAVYKARGHGPLTVATPQGSPNAASAQRVAREVVRLAEDNGLFADSVQTQPYNVSTEEQSAPVLLSFTRFVASASPCGDWSRNAGESLRNQPLPDYGCATQNNLAAMLEDPHDLLAPRGMTEADAERRAVVFDKYRKGEPTAVKRPADEKANVSEVAQ